MAVPAATELNVHAAEIATGPGRRPALRIAHFALGRTNPEAADGIDRTVYYLSRAQAALGHSVRLFSITNKPPIPIPGVEVSAYPSLVPPRLLTSPRLRDLLVWRSPFNLPRRLCDDVVAWRPDVLHLHGVHMPQHLRLAWRARRAGIPYCVTTHGMLAAAAERRRPWIKRLVARVERPFLDRAACLHALGEAERDDLRAYGTSAPIFVAPNGVDAAALRPSPSSRDAGGLEFVFLGRLDGEQKGLDLLIEGLARSGLSEATLTLIGPDWRDGRRTLEALAQQSGVGGRVRFAGPAFGSAKLAMLGGPSVFVLTSRWEGLPFVVLEAACLEKAMLLTAVADPGGRFGPAGAATIVGGTVAEIAEGLRAMARLTLEQRQAMGRRARALVEAEFAWPAVAQTVIDAYRRHCHAGTI